MRPSGIRPEGERNARETGSGIVVIVRVWVAVHNLRGPRPQRLPVNVAPVISLAAVAISTLTGVHHR